LRPGGGHAKKLTLPRRPGPKKSVFGGSYDQYTTHTHTHIYRHARQFYRRTHSPHKKKIVLLSSGAPSDCGSFGGARNHDRSIQLGLRAHIFCQWIAFRKLLKRVCFLLLLLLLFLLLLFTKTPLLPPQAPPLHKELASVLPAVNLSVIRKERHKGKEGQSLQHVEARLQGDFARLTVHVYT
jgi:hypothetical protein